MPRTSWGGLVSSISRLLGQLEGRFFFYPTRKGTGFHLVPVSRTCDLPKARIIAKNSEFLPLRMREKKMTNPKRCSRTCFW